MAKNLLLISIGLLLTAGCAPNRSLAPLDLNNISDFNISRRFDLITPDSIPTLQVYNQANEPVANAEILIGDALDTPFKNNVFKTDQNGFVQIINWKESAHVTVKAQGYIRQTLLNQKPGQLQIKLNTAYLNPRPVIKGQVTNLPVDNGDKNIDFALVIPTIAKSDLLNFDLGTVISPYTDTVDIILGQQADLPSNVSLPTQRESYAFLPVTLSKPEHRVYALNYGPKTYYALTGRFPFKTVVGELQDGKQFYEILNYFNFTSGGLREATVAGPSTQLNIPGNEIKFSEQVTVTGARIPNDEILMSLSVSDLSGSRFIPSDVKRLNADKETKLKIISGKPTYIVSLLKKQADFDVNTADGVDRTSASIIPYNKNMQSSVLPLMANAPAVVENNGSYKIMIPEASRITTDAQTINPMAVSISISNIKIIKDGAYEVEMLDRQWEIWGTAWPNEVQLPQWPLEDNAPRRKFEVNLIGSQSSELFDLGDQLVKAATHVTRAATELKSESTTEIK